MTNPLTINQKKEAKKIISFLKSTFKKQKINNAIIGLSCGLDSTVSFYLLAQALPKKNIYAYHLPYGKENIFVRKIINQIDLPKENFQIISIKKIVDLLKQLTNNHLAVNRIRLGNIIARARMVILFDQAKKHDALVCGTENKSEHLLGYFTRFGDAASDIEPVRHLYKTQLYQLAKYLRIPKEIIGKMPSANLWEGQTDEGEFGFTYDEADQVLNLHFDKKMSTEKIIKMGHKNARKVLSFVKKNSFKQETPYKI